MLWFGWKEGFATNIIILLQSVSLEVDALKILTKRTHASGSKTSSRSLWAPLAWNVVTAVLVAVSLFRGRRMGQDVQLCPAKHSVAVTKVASFLNFPSEAILYS